MDPRELEFRGFADEDDYNSLLEEVSILNQATGVLSTEDLDAIKTSAAKPAIIELLGELKTADDPRRERATDIPLVPEFIEDQPIPFTGGRSLEDFRRGALEATEKRVMRSGVELPPPAAKVFPTEEQLMEEAVVRPEDEPAPFAPDLDIQQKTLDDQAREMRRVIEEDVTPGGAKESVLIGPLYEGTRSLVEATGVPVLAPMARGMGKQILTESPAEEKAMQDYLHSSYYDQARTEYIQYLDGLDPDEKRIEWQPFLLKYAGDVPLKDWLNNALTEMEEGRTVESDTSQIMRGLMAPISAAYGVIEGTAALAGMGDARPFAQAIEQRVVEGGGSATAFEEAARYMAETVGFSETAEEFFGNAAWYTGFGVDFIIPIDLGIVGDAGRLVKTAARMGQDVGGVSAKAALSAKDRAQVWASQITIARGAAKILEGGTLGKVKTGIVNPLDPRVSAISKVYMSEDAVNAVEDLLRAQEVAGPTRVVDEGKPGMPDIERVENITPEHLAEGRAVKYTEDITEPGVKMYDPAISSRIVSEKPYKPTGQKGRLKLGKTKNADPKVKQYFTYAEAVLKKFKVDITDPMVTADDLINKGLDARTAERLTPPVPVKSISLQGGPETPSVYINAFRKRGAEEIYEVRVRVVEPTDGVAKNTRPYRDYLGPDTAEDFTSFAGLYGKARSAGDDVPTPMFRGKIQTPEGPSIPSLDPRFQRGTRDLFTEGVSLEMEGVSGWAPAWFDNVRFSSYNRARAAVDKVAARFSNDLNNLFEFPPASDLVYLTFDDVIEESIPSFSSTRNPIFSVNMRKPGNFKWLFEGGPDGNQGIISWWLGGTKAYGKKLDAYIRAAEKDGLFFKTDTAAAYARYRLTIDTMDEIIEAFSMMGDRFLNPKLQSKRNSLVEYMAKLDESAMPPGAKAIMDEAALGAIGNLQGLFSIVGYGLNSRLGRLFLEPSGKRLLSTLSADDLRTVIDSFGFDLPTPKLKKFMESTEAIVPTKGLEPFMSVRLDPDVRHFTRILDRTRDLGIPTKVADFNKLVEDGIANAIVFETGPVVEKLKAAKQSLATGTLPELSREANLALARGILREQAQSTLAKSMEAASRFAGGLDQLRVGSLFIERTTLERVVKQLDESPIGKLNKYYIDEISKKLAAGEEVTNSTLIEIPQSLLREVQAYVKNLDQFGQTPARRRLQDLGLTQIRQDVSGEQINIIREAALMEFATRLPGTETAVGKALTAQTLRTKGGVSARLEAASIEELFAPEAIRLGPLARGLREGTRAVSEAMFGPTRVYNPITREYIDTIKNRFGAIQESYNSRVMRNRAQGFTPSEAFGKTVADVYAGRIEDLFDDYISIMFGGHETISQTLQTTGRTIELSKISLPVHKIKSLIAELGEEPNSFLNKGKRAFAKLIADGKYDEAYQVLVSVHKTMQGRPLGDFIEMGADRFMGANGAGKFLQELSREVPIYSFKNHTQLLIANFIAREQANIVKQTAEEFRRLDPFLFPTQQFVARFITTDSKHRGVIFANEMRRSRRTMRFGSPTEEELKRLYEASMADAIDAATGVDVTDRMSPIIQDIADAMVQRSGSALDATEEIKHALGLAYGKAAHRSGYTVPTPGERYIKNLGSSVGRNLSEEEYKVIMESSRRMFEKARKPTGPGLVPAGPAEALMDIPIAFEGITSKVALIKATDIEGLSEVLENIKLISPMGTAPSKFNLSDDTLEFMEELIGHAEKIKLDPAPGVQRLAKIIGDTLSPAKNLEAGANIAKTGVLSGVTPIANINFLMANALTAPAIIDSTVGGRYAMSVFNIDVIDVMKQVYGMRLMGQKISDRVLFTHPVTREPITTSMLADLVVDNSITKSQARAEISSNILESMLRYSGQLADGTSVGFIKDQMRRNWNPAREMNLTTQLGNGTDVAFRVGVLVKALKEGKSKQEAIRLAREALFDYGGLSNFEKKYIAKVAWFYTFQRQAIKTVLKTMVNNPTRAKNAAKLAQNIGGYDDRQFYPDSRDYLNSRARLAIIDDKENQRRYSLYGPSIPYISAMDDIINYLSFIPLMAKAPDAPLEAAETIGLELASKASPLYRFAAAIMFGKEIKFGEARTFGTYLDPRMVWYLSRNAELWEAYTSVVNLEPVPQDEARYGSTTYAGVQWRIPYDDMASRRAHYAFMEAALGIGLKRTIMDYGGIAATEESMPGEVPGSRLALQEDWQEWLRSMGVITAVDEPLPDEIPLRTREQRIRSLRELK